MIGRVCSIRCPCGLFLFFVARRLHLERSDFTLAKITANAAALVVLTFFFLISLCTGLIALVGLSEGDWLAGFLIGSAACGCLWVGVTLSRAVGRRIERLR